jgi:hypothetical protein
MYTIAPVGAGFITPVGVRIHVYSPIKNGTIDAAEKQKKYLLE